PRPDRRRRELGRAAGLFHEAAAGRTGSLQRLPRPDRAAGQGPLPLAAALRELSDRRPLPEARARRVKGACVRSPLLLLVLCAAPAPAQDFWAHWGDGRAELNGYRLVQPRYGATRTGTALPDFVTEDMSDALRVKADPGQHPAADVYPVMKLNAIRDVQTGIYDYNVMTSAFARVADGWPVAKVSFASQGWCGDVSHPL